MPAKDQVKNRLYWRTWYAKHRAEFNMQQEQRRAKTGFYHSAKFLARKKVDYVVKVGKLTRLPCEVCGVKRGIDAHHYDYSKPLEVRWLCRIHHAQTHQSCPQATEITVDDTVSLDRD